MSDTAISDIIDELDESVGFDRLGYRDPLDSFDSTMAILRALDVLNKNVSITNEFLVDIRSGVERLPAGTEGVGTDT